MRKLFPFLLLLAFSQAAFAQSDCSSGRYVNEIFSGVDVTSDILYGWNVDLNNATDSLHLDIYEPQGDTLSLRPLMIWSHGGSFVGGDKNGNDVVPLCEIFARKGYVTSSIDYRLGMPLFGVDSTAATEAVMRTVQDAKAAVRWFYKSAQNGNPYRVDTTRILMCGVSAGGFVALHYAYLDDMSEFPSWVDTTNPGLGGGLSGNSGNPGYSEDIIGVVNVAGALGDTTWIQPGDEPLVSLHGNQDQTVPYGTDLIYLLGVFPIMEVDGSHSVHLRADHVGLQHCFYTYFNADHVPHVGNAAYTDTTVDVITNFIIERVCPSISASCVIQTGVTAPLSQPIGIAPVPSSEEVSVVIPQGLNGQLVLCDVTGRVIRAWENQGSGSLRIQREGMSRGVYFLRFTSGDRMLHGKIVWE